MRTLLLSSCISATCLMTAIHAGEPQPPTPAAPPAAANPVKNAPPAAPGLSEQDIAAITALADEAVKLGLPDAKGAEFWLGTVQVERQENGASRGQPLHGLHAKLSDGSWWIRLRRLVVPSKTVKVTPEKLAVQIPLQRFAPIARDHVHDAGCQHGHDQELAQYTRQTSTDFKGLMTAYQLTNLDRLLPAFAAADQPRVRALLAGDPTAPRLGWDQEASDNVTLLALIRAGVPGLAAKALASVAPAPGTDQDKLPAYLRSRVANDRRPLFLDPIDQQRALQLKQAKMGFRSAEQEAAPPAGSLTILSPVDSLRQTLCAWFTEALADSESGLPADRLVAAVKALQPAQPAAGQVANLERLLAGQALTRTVPEGADIATRLTVWRTGGNRNLGNFLREDAMERRFARLTPDEVAKLPEHLRKDYALYQAILKADFTGKDLDALIGLAGDTRPTRWVEGGSFQGPVLAHTVGDNALRALRRVLGFDPRLAVGRDPMAAWDDAERAATAAALAAWWKPLAGKPLAEIQLSLIASLPLDNAVSLIVKESDPAKRGPAWAACAKVLATAKPEEIEPNVLGRLLRAANDDAAIAGVVAAWPVGGRHRLLLAAWHDLHGRPEQLDALVDAELTDVSKPGQAETAALAAAVRRPSPARLTRFVTVLKGGLEQGPARRLVAAIITSRGELPLGDPALSALIDGDAWVGSPSREARQKQDVLGIALVQQLLQDKRQLPKDLVTLSPLIEAAPKQPRLLQVAGIPLWLPGLEDRSFTAVKEDWRVCDLAALACSQTLQRKVDPHGNPVSFAFDLSAESGQRDARIAGMLQAMAERMEQRMKDAGLATPPAKDDKPR